MSSPSWRLARGSAALAAMVIMIFAGCGGGGGSGDTGASGCSTSADCGCCKCTACVNGTEVVPLKCESGSCAECSSACAAAGCNFIKGASVAPSCAGAIGCDHQGYPCEGASDCCGILSCSATGYCD